MRQKASYAGVSYMLIGVTERQRLGLVYRRDIQYYRCVRERCRLGSLGITASEVTRTNMYERSV